MENSPIARGLMACRNLTQGVYTEHSAAELGLTTSGFSELLMHVGLSEQPAHTIWINERGTYAYVMFRDGRFTDGCYHRFADGTFSLS